MTGWDATRRQLARDRLELYTKAMNEHFNRWDKTNRAIGDMQREWKRQDRIVRRMVILGVSIAAAIVVVVLWMT